MARPKKDDSGNDGISAKDKILNAAESLFATKGYDAATIGEIGKLAGVNSALLYYYFANKEAILRQLMENAIAEVNRMVDDRFNKITLIDTETFEVFVTDILDFLQRKRQILIIMMTEITRIGRENTYIFELMSPVYENVITKLKGFNIDTSNLNYMRLKLFLLFTSPLLLGIMIGDEWRKYYNISGKEYQDLYMRAMKELSELVGLPKDKK
ncbi:MAG: TetR/AcrR family transcriptional regulator [Brevinematales bacterium]|nr:TetR/AcrR family transcriptional regulator [Brevinematales bacterium]